MSDSHFEIFQIKTWSSYFLLFIQCWPQHPYKWKQFSKCPVGMTYDTEQRIDPEEFKPSLYLDHYAVA